MQRGPFRSRRANAYPLAAVLVLVCVLAAPADARPVRGMVGQRNSLLGAIGKARDAVGWKLRRAVTRARALLGDKRPVLVGPRGDPIAPQWQAEGRVVYGVMGRAGAEQLPRALVRSQEQVGATIAELGGITLNGACPGRPENAARGARRAGGIVVGVSPWASWKAHKRSGAPTVYDVVKLTRLPAPLRHRVGEPNYMGREIDNIIHSDAVVVLGGGWGTLGELSIAVEYQRPVGVLIKNGPGVANSVASLEREISKAGKPPRAPIIYDSDSDRLVRRLHQAVLDQRASGNGKHAAPLGDTR